MSLPVPAADDDQRRSTEPVSEFDREQALLAAVRMAVRTYGGRVLSREAESRLRLVMEANDALAAAQQGRTLAIVCLVRHRLQDAVDSARDAGIEWVTIGGVLGIPPGSAYQRFHVRGRRTNH